MLCGLPGTAPGWKDGRPGSNIHPGCNRGGGSGNNLNSLSDQYARIFLLSHMRSFSSLAGHILGSHPQVNGYYEMHLSYDEPQALERQLARYLEHDVPKAGSRYLFDKLLHDEYRLRLERLGIPGVKILVALREPEQSIRSIVSLFARKQAGEPYASPLAAANYYIERVSTLAGFCRAAGRGCFYYDAEMLQDAPGILLPALERWLDLDSPLRDRYAVFSQTGKDRAGDSSETIRTGRIDTARRDYSGIPIPGEVLLRARQVYRDCRGQILCAAAEAVTR